MRTKEESYIDAHRVSIKQVDAVLEAWSRKPQGVATADGYIMIRPVDYEGLINQNDVVTILTKHGRFETTATAELVQRIFTPPSVRPCLSTVHGFCGASNNDLIGFNPGIWVDPGEQW